MKIADLIKKINKFNEDTLPGILPPATPVNPGYASVQIKSVDLPCRHEFCGKTKASGKTTSYTSSSSFVKECLTLSDTDSVCVGAVIDNVTQDSTDDLPVVLAVGINYGQGSGYLMGVPGTRYPMGVPVIDTTDMRPRLKDVYTFPSKAACTAETEAFNGDFHLVAANFFPWITGKKWSLYGFNSLEDATLIHCCGHFSPMDYIRDLMVRIQPCTVVFHGVDNAVPYLGGCVSRQILAPIGFEVIFCDNLAPSGRPVSNAIKL